MAASTERWRRAVRIVAEVCTSGTGRVLVSYMNSDNSESRNNIQQYYSLIFRYSLMFCCIKVILSNTCN